MSETQDQKTVYVGGFSFDTTAAALHAAFLPFGDISDLQLPKDPSNRGPHKGFGFITFSSAASALDAIDNMHRNVLPGPSNSGKPLKVNSAKAPKPSQKGAGNRAIWEDEEWLKEHGMQPVAPNQVGTEGGASEAVE